MKTNNLTEVSKQRMALMQAGMVDLNQWLLDIIRHGLAELERKDESFWMDMAVRLVDCQLGSLARKVRMMSETFGKGAAWPSLVLEQIADLHLAVKGFSNLESLPDPLRADLLAFVGVNISKKKLLDQQGLPDSWLALGSITGIEENLTYRRTWFQGAESKRMALLLDFVHGNRSFETDWKAGNAIQTEAVFYPSGFPLRAVFKTTEGQAPKTQNMDGFDDLSDLAASYSQALAGNPWLPVFPAVLKNVIPFKDSEDFFCMDINRRYIPFAEDAMRFWQVLALSGGEQIDVFGEWDGSSFLPISVFAENMLIAI